MFAVKRRRLEIDWVQRSPPRIQHWDFNETAGFWLTLPADCRKKICGFDPSRIARRIQYPYYPIFSPVDTHLTTEFASLKPILIPNSIKVVISQLLRSRNIRALDLRCLKKSSAKAFGELSKHYIVPKLEKLRVVLLALAFDVRDHLKRFINRFDMKPEALNSICRLPSPDGSLHIVFECTNGISILLPLLAWLEKGCFKSVKISSDDRSLTKFELPNDLIVHPSLIDLAVHNQSIVHLDKQHLTSVERLVIHQCSLPAKMEIESNRLRFFSLSSGPSDADHLLSIQSSSLEFLRVDSPASLHLSAPNLKTFVLGPAASHSR